MVKARKIVRFDNVLSEKQKADLVAGQNKIIGLDTLNGLTIFPSIEDSTVLYWGDDLVEKQIRDIIEGAEI